MRNLKRVLALAMAMIMMLGMMVIGTSAASYKDAETIDANYAEAIEILTNMGVFKGQSTSESVFAPKAVLTRAEAAALIYRVITGDVTDAQKANYDYASLKDVKAGEWYTSYVTYANNGGYIKGDENGNFNPKADVTGVQVLAIMLRAAGFGQNGEYEGKAWKDNILTDAYELGIIGGISTATLNAPATRELVAQLLFNAMSEVQMVSYTPLLGYFGYGKTTLGEKVFGLKKVTGVITANEKADLYSAKALAAGKTALDKDTKNLYNLSTDETIIGEKVSFWACKNTAVSTPKSLAKVTDLSNRTDAPQGFETKGYELFYNYDAANTVKFGKGIEVKMIDNGQGYPSYVLVVEKTLSEVKYISTTGVITLTGVISEKNQKAYDGIAVGDIVLTVSYDGTTYIETPAYVTGIVTGVNYGLEKTAVIGGEKYAVSGLANKSSANTFKTVNDTYQPGADWNGKKYDYFLDNYGNIIAYTYASELDTGYALILDYDIYKSSAFSGDLSWRPSNGLSFGDLYIAYLTEEGNVETAKVDADFAKYFGDSNTGYVDFTVLVGDVVSYRIDEDGEFVLAYTYAPVMSEQGSNATVEIDATTDVAYVRNAAQGGEDISGKYGVDDDLVVFYYANSLTDINIARGDLLKWILGGGVGNTLLWGTPVYGVLTGADAIADLRFEKNLYQIDCETGANNHLYKNGSVSMMNIRGHIDTLVDYCYVSSWTNYSSYKLDGKYYWEYKAIGSDGSEIKVVTTHPCHNDENAENVWGYHTLNINGVQVNELLPVEATGAHVMKGDLHDSTNGKTFTIYEWDDQTGESFADPAHFIDVTTGKDVALSYQYCSTGVIVVEGEFDATVVAAFIEKPTYNEPTFIDTTVTLLSAEAKNVHLEIGTTIELAEGCYTVKVGEKTETLHDVKAVKVAASWEGKTVVITKVDPCKVCNPDPTSKAMITALIDSDNKETVVYNGNGDAYTTLTEAVAKVKTIDKGTANNVQLMLKETSVTAVAYRNFTKTADIKAADINVGIIETGIIALANPGEYIAVAITDADGAVWYAVFTVK